MSRQVSARFWAKVVKSDSCWLWKAATNPRGYGRFHVGGSLVYAHRWSYEQAHGPIPTGAVIDHLCRTVGCVRPSHLEAVAQGENTARGRLGFKLNGRCRSDLHDVTDPSAVYVLGDGRRRCRACHYNNNLKYGRAS